MNIESDRPSRIINAQEAAELLKVSTRRVRAMISAGQLPAEKIGRDWLIKAVDLYPLYDRKPGRPSQTAKQQRSVRQLPAPAATLVESLTPQREPVATVYRRLKWTRQQLEQTITEHRAELERAGMHLHVATHADASGRMDRYITIDGTRYSNISRDARPAREV